MAQLKDGAFVMHKKEGWYGQVISLRSSEGSDRKIYRIRILDPKEYYPLEDLTELSIEEVPEHFLQKARQENK